MQKAERAEKIRKTARELASSGKFDDYRAIEYMLVAQGLPDAPEALEIDSLRRELREICVRARTARLERKL